MLYSAGQTISFRFTNDDGSQTMRPKTIAVDILKVFEPVTYNLVLHVSLRDSKSIHPSMPETAILKLYDRRITPSIRKGPGFDYEPIPDWNAEHEEEVLHLLSSPNAAEFYCKNAKTGLNIYPESNWTQAQKEVWVESTCWSLRENEVAAYKAFEELQGKYVPILYGELDLINDAEENKGTEWSVKGILIEYIEGFVLADLAENVSEEEEQAKVVDETIRVLHLLDEKEVLNKDVRPENVVLRREVGHNSLNKVTYNPVFIDFAISKVRGEGDGRVSDGHWTMMKANQDEEGAIGAAMQRKLRKKVGRKKGKDVWVETYHWEPSNRYKVRGNEFEWYEGPMGKFQAKRDEDGNLISLDTIFEDPETF